MSDPEQVSSNTITENDLAFTIPANTTLADIVGLIKIQNREFQEYKSMVCNQIKTLQNTVMEHNDTLLKRNDNLTNFSPIPSTSQEPTSSSTNDPTPTDNTRHRCTHENYSKLSAKDFIQALPFFDGSAEGYDLNEFTLHCKNAKDYIPHYKEYEILVLLTGRLKGEALRRISKMKPRTIQDFINFLHDSFDQPKTYLSLKEDIKKLSQGRNEKMNTYAARVEELFTATLEQLYLSNTNNKAAAEAILNEEIIIGFMQGLRKEYLLLFKEKSFPNLAFAIAEGRRVEKELTIFPKLSLNTVENSYVTQPEGNQNSRQNNNYNQKPRCTFCDRIGHLAENCYKKQAQNRTHYEPKIFTPQRQDYSTPSQSYKPYNQHTNNDNTNQNSTPHQKHQYDQPSKYSNAQQYSTHYNSKITCAYCKKPGHSINECRKREYNNRMHVNDSSNFNKNLNTGNDNGPRSTGAISGQNSNSRPSQNNNQ